MLLGRDVAEHGRAEPADHGRPDGRSDVVVAGRHIGGQRPQRIEGRLVADAQLLIHVGLDLVQRHVAGPLDHHLHVTRPGHLGEFAKGLQLGELGRVVGVGDGARAQAVAQ